MENQRLIETFSHRSNATTVAGCGQESPPGGARRSARPPRQRLMRSSIPSLTMLLGGLTVTCAALVVFGSTFFFPTTRYWDHGDGTASGMKEGAARWAGWTFLSGLAALAILALGARLVGENRRRWEAAFALAAAAPLLFAAQWANHNWQRLLEEQERPRDYVLVISPGLPLVTISAVAGTFFALLLAVAWARR